MQLAAIFSSAKPEGNLVAIHIGWSECRRASDAPHATIVVVSGIDDVLKEKKALADLSHLEYRGKLIELFQVSVKGAQVLRQTSAPARRVIPLRELMPFQNSPSQADRTYGPFPNIFETFSSNIIRRCSEVAALRYTGEPSIGRPNDIIVPALTPADCRKVMEQVLRAVDWKELPQQN
jgi:hypothetical protein